MTKLKIDTTQKNDDLKNLINHQSIKIKNQKDEIEAKMKSHRELELKLKKIQKSIL